MISTPDHWHVPMSLMALEAGKDVFCEKPTLYIDEGRTLMDEVAKRGAVFQVGLEDRSLIHFHKMVEWVKNGAIGRLERIAVELPCGINHAKEAEAPVPGDLDWNLWLGPAPFHPFTRSRTRGMTWRFIKDYGNGSLVDWGTHLVDTAQLAADAPGVSTVEVEGTGEIPTGRMSDTPVSFDLKYRYANGVEMTVRSGSSPSGDGRSASIRFTGDKGWVGRKPWSGQLKASDPGILRTRYKPEETKHWPLPPREQRNFLDCVKSRKPTTYTAADMHLLHVTLHMGIIAMTLGRKLTWDTRKEEFIGDDDANRMRRGVKARDWQSGV
jgi:predicted dehydrogenase